MMMQVAIEAYITSLDQMNTRYAYRRDLSQLCQWLTAQGVESWSAVTSDQITAYLLELSSVDDNTQQQHSGGYSPSTIYRKYAAIKSFFVALCQQPNGGGGIIPLNPMEKVASCAGIIGTTAAHFHHQKKEVLHALSQEQIDCLLEQVNNNEVTTPGGLRDRALLHLLLCTGMLASELLSLNLCDVHAAEVHLVCRSSSSSRGGSGSSRRDRVLPLDVLAAEAIQHYLEQSRPLLVRDPREQALFLNISPGERLSRQGFWLIIRGYARNVGVAITPRMLRQTCAMRMLSAGVDVHTVQHVLGHATVAITKRYVVNRPEQTVEGEEGGTQQ